MSTSNSNAQKLYILGSGQIIHVCMPNASQIFKNHRPITPITKNKVWKIQKK